MMCERRVYYIEYVLFVKQIKENIHSRKKYAKGLSLYIETCLIS